jgi:hypothetical protein
MRQQLFEPIHRIYPPHAIIGGERRATFGGKKKKED